MYRVNAIVFEELSRVNAAVTVDDDARTWRYCPYQVDKSKSIGHVGNTFTPNRYERVTTQESLCIVLRRVRTNCAIKQINVQAMRIEEGGRPAKIRKPKIDSLIEASEAGRRKQNGSISYVAPPAEVTSLPKGARAAAP